MDTDKANINNTDGKCSQKERLQLDDGVEHRYEVNIMTGHYNITQQVSPQKSTEHTNISSYDVDFLISENQENDIAEWDNDASPN